MLTSKKKSNVNASFPLFEHYMLYWGKNPVPFNTPGHKGKWPLSGFETVEHLAKADIPDDIFGFPGARRRSEKIAAEIYGTRRTFYLVNGSSAGVHAQFLSTMKPGEIVLMGRNLHASAVTAMVMTGVIPVYIPIDIGADGIPLNVSVESVKEAINENSGAKGVFIISPSYFGICANILEIANIVHNKNMLFLDDEAWGAHFPFGEGFPPSAIAAGADIIVQGAHKTLATLSGTALLHVNSNRIDDDLVDLSLGMVETTSPNMIMYLSLENVINLMFKKGKEILKKAQDSISYVIEHLQGKMGIFKMIFCPDEKLKWDRFTFDPVKLLLIIDYKQTGITGFDVAETMIEKFGVIPEIAGINYILFIFTGFEEETEVCKLAKALEEVSAAYMRIARCGLSKIFDYPMEALPIPRLSLSPREAFFSDGDVIPLEQAIGRTAKSMVIPYPPGIPILLPGEIISKEIIEYHKILMNLGGIVRGIINRNDELYIEVIK